MSSSRRFSRGFNNRGTSLIEVLISMILLSILTTAIFFVLQKSIGYYLITANQTDLQQAALKVAQEVSRDLAESDVSSIQPYPSPSPFPGVVFASPRDSSGNVGYDTSGNLQWQTYICYYIDTVQGVPTLFRKFESIPTKTSTAPATSSFSTKTTSYFRNATTDSPRAVGPAISTLSLSKLTQAGDLYGTFLNASGFLILSVTASNPMAYQQMSSRNQSTDKVSVAYNVWIRN